MDTRHQSTLLTDKECRGFIVSAFSGYPPKERDHLRAIALHQLQANPAVWEICHDAFVLHKILANACKQELFYKDSAINLADIYEIISQYEFDEIYDDLYPSEDGKSSHDQDYILDKEKFEELASQFAFCMSLYYFNKISHPNTWAEALKEVAEEFCEEDESEFIEKFEHRIEEKVFRVFDLSPYLKDYALAMQVYRYIFHDNKENKLETLKEKISSQECDRIWAIAAGMAEKAYKEKKMALVEVPLNNVDMKSMIKLSGRYADPNQVKPVVQSEELKRVGKNYGI